MIVRGVVKKIQNKAPEKELVDLDDIFIDKKVYSNIYLIVAMGFVIILILGMNVPSNLQGLKKYIVIGCFVLLILLFCLIGFLYRRVYVKFGRDKIYWRKMCGKDETISYEDITSFRIDGTGNMKLYRDDKCFLCFSTEGYKEFIIELLKNHKVGVKTNE